MRVTFLHFVLTLLIIFSITMPVFGMFAEEEELEEEQQMHAKRARSPTAQTLPEEKQFKQIKSLQNEPQLSSANFRGGSVVENSPADLLAEPEPEQVHAQEVAQESRSELTIKILERAQKRYEEKIQGFWPWKVM